MKFEMTDDIKRMAESIVENEAYRRGYLGDDADSPLADEEKVLIVAVMMLLDKLEASEKKNGLLRDIVMKDPSIKGAGKRIRKTEDHLKTTDELVAEIAKGEKTIIEESGMEDVKETLKKMGHEVKTIKMTDKKKPKRKKK